MNITKTLLSILFLSIFATVTAQEEKKNNFRFSGQVSAWGQYAPDIEESLWLGGRYIPQINYEMLFKQNSKFDIEASANIFGECGIIPFSEAETNGKIKPYRTWVRYSNNNTEFRVGLQKINFGSAQMLRPLMWFDKMDPRDPLQMTDGVWGGLFRYYFKNNANLWLWGLAMNEEPKAWESLSTAGKIHPEAGGRLQIPIKRGETAISYHTRNANVMEYVTKTLMLDPLVPIEPIKEHRFGFDVRADMVIGMWLETSWTHLPENGFLFHNQLMTTVGTDYTIGIGNGLGISIEHLYFLQNNKNNDFRETTNFTAANFNYPVSLFGNANAIFYYDWRNKGFYNFVSFNYQITDITLYLMAYWNPNNSVLPMQNESVRFMGKGVQMMMVWNY